MSLEGEKFPWRYDFLRNQGKEVGYRRAIKTGNSRRFNGLLPADRSFQRLSERIGPAQDVFFALRFYHHARERLGS